MNESPTVYSQVFGVPDAYRDLHDATVESIAVFLESLSPSVLAGVCARMRLIQMMDDVDELFADE